MGSGDSGRLEVLPLYDGARPCVNSGFCCKQGPCPFGESLSQHDPTCRHLVATETPVGKRPRYLCSIAGQIIGKPGWENAPAFGAGCCSPFNTDRQAIIQELDDEQKILRATAG